jgi:hypothetical protein
MVKHRDHFAKDNSCDCVEPVVVLDRRSIHPTRGDGQRMKHHMVCIRNTPTLLALTHQDCVVFFFFRKWYEMF